MNIGTVIMNKRKYLGLTQQALANELNVSFQAISNGKTVLHVLILIYYRR